MVRNPQQTRERLLEAAYKEMHTRGFQGMRVDEVLRQSGLQKGAFYHHFSSKTELGYAVLEEQIRPILETLWVEPLEKISNPLTELPKLISTLGERIPPLMYKHGCPLNNLAQEMSAQDEGFQVRIALMFNDWVKSFTQLFAAGQASGYVRTDVDACEVARFLVAVLEGCIGLFKVEHSPEQWLACQSQLEIYLGGLAPKSQ